MGKALVLLFGAIFAVAGCSSEPKAVGVQPVVKPAASAAGEEVIFRSMEPVPDWVNRGADRYPDRDPNFIYFLGIGLPNPYQAKARDSARENGAEQISNYLMNSVKQAEYYSDKLQNSKGYVPIQTLVRETVGKHVTEAILRGQYEKDLYFEKLQQSENRVPQTYYHYVAVYAYPKDGLKQCLQDAKRDFEQQAAAQDLAENNDIKKELIASSVKMIDDMAAQDFATQRQ